MERFAGEQEKNTIGIITEWVSLRGEWTKEAGASSVSVQRVLHLEMTVCVFVGGGAWCVLLNVNWPAFNWTQAWTLENNHNLLSNLFTVNGLRSVLTITFTLHCCCFVM